MAALGPRGDGEDVRIARSFLNAVGENCPPITEEDIEKLLTCLLEQLGVGAENAVAGSMCGSSLQDSSSLWNTKGDEGSNETSSKVKEGGLPGRTSLDQNVVIFEGESFEELDKQVNAFKLLDQMLEKVESSKAAHVDALRMVTVNQLKSLPPFLKIRKRDWKEQGAVLKARIIKKVSIC